MNEAIVIYGIDENGDPRPILIDIDGTVQVG